MRWPRRWRNRKETVATIDEEAGVEARMRAEKGLQETRAQWSKIHVVSEGLERARATVGQDPFLEEMARAMRAQPRKRRDTQ